MNDFLHLCLKRRSVRAYRQTAVPATDLEYVMECVRMAPSAVNRQPWDFRLVTDRASLDRLARCYDREWFSSVPACFVACRDKEREWVRSQDGKPHGDIDVEHLCLAAAERGLGTCWVCNFDVPRCREALGIAPSLEPVALVPIGYPADGDAPAAKVRRALRYLPE